MVRLRNSDAPKRSFRVLVIFPLIITGVASVCAAVPLICLSSLTVLSVVLRVGDISYAEFRLASAPDRLQQDIQFVSFESRFSSAQPLLRNATIAGPASVPNGLQQDIQFIGFDEPTLAPVAFTQFCFKYPGDCKPQRLFSAGDRIELDQMHLSEIESINHDVNSSIHPERNEDGLAGEKWLLSPLRGDCNDYAVTKRHQLIARGWPARTVLLSEVVTLSGEHHLVTIVRTNSGDLVLDNLTDQIMPWSRTGYRWVRIQTPKNPNYWASISKQNV
jgi:predicted transglutaminase-like cysteine proteinase